jgi:hypothetical protein
MPNLKFGAANKVDELHGFQVTIRQKVITLSSPSISRHPSDP